MTKVIRNQISTKQVIVSKEYGNFKLQKGIVMKTILALATALIVGSAFAQTSSTEPVAGQPRHMLEFNADSILQGVLSFDKTKTPGKANDNDTSLDLRLNYAYLVHRNMQLGIRGTFQSGVQNALDREVFGAEVGAIWNFQPEHIMNSIYASGYVGGLYSQTFGTDSGRDEVYTGTLALGKRFDMKRWGLNHVVYSPEVALEYANSVDDKNFDYTQALEIRFLQFSVLF
jgi:hypothetical protein